MRINYREGDIEFKGVFIPLQKVKEALLKKFPSIPVEYQIGKRFDKKTGEIIRQVSWDSVFFDLKRDGRIYPILNKLIQNI